ncbi:MAG: TraR/DksA family transcriptional regulator [Acidobacteria bacterium]|nr:TraR/DksA family transcriptional regulator [Acidobacteriota bacterium]
MTNFELERFRQILEAKAAEFENSTRQRDGICVEGSADELDRVLQARQREIAVQRLEAASSRLRDTRAALLRMEQGRYGFCLECDERISSKRLQALPWAPLCVQCQEANDQWNAVKSTRALPMAA